MIRLEPDEDYRRRIIDAYGMWGAFCSEVLESSGSALDECGEFIGVARRNDCEDSDDTSNPT